MAREEIQVLEPEDVILGTIISYPSAYDKVYGYLADKNVLESNKARLLWDKIKEMKRRGEHVDMISIASNLSAEDKIQGLNAYYITGCATNTHLEGTVEYHAMKVYEKYLLRRVVEKSVEIAKKAKDNAPDVYEVVGDAHALFGELLEARPSVSTDIEDVISDTLDEINNKTSKLIKTEYPGLDQFAGGLTKGEITIIGGRPGHGKTTFMINMLSRVLDAGNKVMFFSRELPNSELFKKILCLESGNLSYGMIRKNIFSEKDLKETNRAIEEIKVKYSKDKFLMFDNIRDFSQAAGEVRKFKPDIVFDDYIQLIKCKGQEDKRRLQIEALVNDYKWLAKEMKTAVVLASQLNRAIELREKDVPRLSDLAESGAIEQVAENVFFTHYAYKVNGNEDKKNEIVISAGKVRYGDTGKVKLGYDGDKCKIFDSKGEILNEEEIPF